MKKNILIILLHFCVSINLFAQTDLLDTSNCIFEYGYADFSDASTIKFIKNAEGMNPLHFRNCKSFKK